METSDSRLDAPLKKTQFAKPEEAALKVTADHQPFDSLHSAILMTHPKKGRRNVLPLLGETDRFIDEGFKARTCCIYAGHFPIDLRGATEAFSTVRCKEGADGAPPIVRETIEKNAHTIPSLG